MDTEAIKPHLIVHARSLKVMHVPEDVHVGRVDHVEGEFIKLTKTDSDDANHHWVPLSWVEKVTDQGVFLNKNVEEFLWGRLDEEPKH
jgi:hypothetical protein